MARLRKHTGSRDLIIEGMQDERLRVVIKLPGSNGGYLYVPAAFWRNFQGASFNQASKDDRGLVRGKTLEVRVEAIADLYRLAAELSRGSTAFADPPRELWPWFLGLTHRSDQFETIPNMSERSNDLVQALLLAGNLRVALTVYEPDLVDFDDYLRMKFAKKKATKPRPIDDIFWYKLIEILSISKIETGQPAVIETMQRWVVSNYPAPPDKKPDCKMIVERIWAENDLAHKVRNRAK